MPEVLDLVGLLCGRKLRDFEEEEGKKGRDLGALFVGAEEEEDDDKRAVTVVGTEGDERRDISWNCLLGGEVEDCRSSGRLPSKVRIGAASMFVATDLLPPLFFRVGMESGRERKKMDGEEPRWTRRAHKIIHVGFVTR
ncbi:hypothetical protein CDL15_Pgr005967 [Punica granatum]|uniref:Uncharacterized protein n=1 Tax=Punica granatum TaxID=22663 RepID=A0A218WH24_PUNGR|nr:hypothetical protein CDL15_Pgr005967 [Punica granatum]PKI54321.1 hypothetical protein CRG98_025289 [Punica granatum]